jgi:FAD/FMN-containing dehydrogenase
MKPRTENLCGWGRYPVRACRVSRVFDPPRLADAFPASRSLLARGLGRSYGDASLVDEDGLALDMTGLNRFISFDPEQGTVRAEAGISLEEILDCIVPRGWFLPVVPGTRMITLGGAIASNVHGKNHHVDGAISNFVTDMTVLTEQGCIRCSPHENRELFFATAGGMGLTGIIVEAQIRLKKIETSMIRARLLRAKNFEEAIRLSRENDRAHVYSVTWIDCLARGKNLGRGIVMLGNHAPIDSLSRRLRENPLHNRWKWHFSIPPIIPDWTLNPWSIRLFNFGFYRKQWKQELHVLSNFENWFFPLDLISNWNLLYGKRGFVQYQFVVPFANGLAGIRKTLEFLSERRIGSFLAVLKIVSEDRVLLPFAKPGFTLALDIPLRYPGIFETLGELDRIVMDHGGRLYLTKDARMTPETFRSMYPEYPSWIQTVRNHSPKKRFSSMMAERLEL